MLALLRLIKGSLFSYGMQLEDICRDATECELMYLSCHDDHLSYLHVHTVPS